MTLILQNTTGADIPVAFTGKTLAANSSRTIDPTDYRYFSTAIIFDSTFQTQVTNGSVVVNVDAVNLSASEGTRFLKGLTNLKVQSDGVLVSSAVETINIQNAGQVSTNGDTLDINVKNLDNDFTGAIFSFQFTTDNDSNNTWLQLSHNNLSSNQTNYVLPFNCKLVALTIGSDDNGQNYDIELWRLNFQSNSPSNFFTQQTNNARYVVNRTISNSNYNFSQGDKIAVFSDSGHDDLNVELWFQVTSSPVTDTIDNINTDIDD